MEKDILLEITPIKDAEFLYIADRHKKEFDYPMHQHEACELNFLENAKGVRRIVGDSSEVIGDLEMTLITSPNMEHVWQQGDCKSEDVHEITIQFYLDYSNGLFTTNPFKSIVKMFDRARCGLAFSPHAIMMVYHRLIRLSGIKEGFYVIRQFFDILYELSKDANAHQLASSSFAKAEVSSDSRRILKVKQYIDAHADEEVHLSEVAALVDMSPNAFSRFFSQHTGESLNTYLLNQRLGKAARLLVDTLMPVSEICYTCGYNTLSNFNRLFKKYKGCSPSEFRKRYHKTKVIV